MASNITSNFSATEIKRLLETSRNAEICRDIEFLQSTLAPVWSDIEVTPHFDFYESESRAELLRLSGFLLTFYGRSRNRRDFQERAKNLLTESFEIFDSIGSNEKSAEAKIILAFCYWNTGETAECGAILDETERLFTKNKSHPVFLQLQINRLLILTGEEKLADAEKLIEKISAAVASCSDLRLRAMFHAEAGIIYRRRKKFMPAVYHFNEAEKLARATANRRFVAVNYNNLAMLYLDMEIFRESRYFADLALDIYTKLGDEGWIPHVLDTKALIYLTEKRFNHALAEIEKALLYFHKGEDWAGRIAALWTKTLCLLRLSRTDEAFSVFGELQMMAIAKIGKLSADKYCRLLTNEIYIIQNLPLTDEVSEFKKSRIRAALIQTDGKITIAAKTLNIKHQTLSEILKNQFPTLYSDLGFQRRNSRRTVFARNRNLLESETVQEEGEIVFLDLPGKMFSFNFLPENEIYQIFFFDEYFMRKIGKMTGAVVAVEPVAEYKAGMTVLVLCGNKFTIAETEFDNYSKIYFVVDDSGEWIPLDADNVIGKPFAYCDIAETDGEFIKFSKLEK